MPFAPIVTKITPPPRRADVLYRARLLDFLHENIDRKLLLISAGAGYGKTTLLVDFVHDTDLTACWYSLDAADRDPRIFVEYLLASLGKAFPGFGQRTHQAFQGGASLSSGAEEVVGTLVNEMVEVIPEWFVLVLDDFHQVEDSPDVCAFLTTFLTYLPEHCHLIVASRTVPGGLPFISLAARGEVVGLGQDDLRFTPEEIQDFLAQSHGVCLTRQEAEVLAAESEGWITGILLTSHVLWGELLESLARARRSGQPVYEYLAGEVLEQQEEAVRTFLLTSSVLREMSASLCEEALGLERAEEMLERLEQRNLFTVRLTETEPPRFRYHALFRDFLQARLRESDPDHFRFLHRRVAAWFEAREEVEVALQHYLDAGDHPELARVLNSVAQDMLTAGRLVTLAEWAGRLSEEPLRAYPRLLLAAAMAVSATGKTEQALEWLSWAEEAFRQRGEYPLLALALARRALLILNQGENERASVLAQEALSLAEGSPDALQAVVEARRILGASLVRLRRFGEAAHHLESALDGSRALGDLRREVLILGGLANCLRWQGRTREAVETQQAAVEAARRLGSPGHLAEALNDLGFYLYLVGDYARALESLEEALHIARKIGHPVVEAYALVSLGELLRDLDEPQVAVEMLDEGRRLAQETGNVFLAAWAHEALALAFLRLGDAQRAVGLARSAIALAERQRSEDQQGRYRATLGLALVEEGALEAGLDELRVACDTLERLGATEEAVRARLLQAQALHRAGLEAEALHLLLVTLEGGCETDQQRLLPLQVPGLMALLKRAAEQNVGGERFAGLVGEVRMLTKRAHRVRGQHRQAQPPHQPVFRFYGFGIGRVERDGDPIPSTAWESLKACHLLFYLLSYPSRTREQIGADLWPDLRPNRLPGTFHNTKYRLQQALGMNPIVYEGGLYRIAEELNYWFDVEAFERLVRQAQRSSPAKAARYFSRAVDLYTGDFLQECYDEWCIARREKLQWQFLEAVHSLSEWLMGRGRFERATEILERGLETDHLREDFHRQLMRVYALLGRPEEALAHYRRCCRILEKELGVEPAPETQALIRRIRRGELGPAGGPSPGEKERRKKG